MMRLRPVLCLAVLILVATFACRNDLDYEPGTGDLEFSRDTVYLDTVFTNTRTATYSLTVYNRSNTDILIPDIGLEGGENSGYQLNVDGQGGKRFTDIPLLAKDSLFIFIETVFDIASVGGDSYLYTDAILFDSGPRAQKIPLITLVKDAVFLFPGKHGNGREETFTLGSDAAGAPVRVSGFYLTEEELVMDAEKPYVIYGYAAPPAGQALKIGAGARLYFHKNSGLYVNEGATLEASGAAGNDPQGEIFFQGDRLEAAYAGVAGQWGGIWLGSGARHSIAHVTIRNATHGIYLSGEQATLQVSNSRIVNSLLTNLYAVGGLINGDNLVLGNAGVSSLVCSGGGPFIFRHCTIANFWSQGPRSGPALQLLSGADHESSFFSCILDGNTAREIGFAGNPAAATVRLTSCMVRYEEDEGAGLQELLPGSQVSELLLNRNPAFLNINEADFRIGPGSEGIGLGHPATALEVPLDLAGENRTASPDIGAYQHLPGNENVIVTTKM